MNWNDQDIDQLFKGVKAPELPPFEEDFWKEIEGQLPPRKRRKTAVWWFGGGFALLVALTGWWVSQPDEVSHAGLASSAHPVQPGITVQSGQENAVQTVTQSPVETVQTRAAYQRTAQRSTLRNRITENREMAEMPPLKEVKRTLDAAAVTDPQPTVVNPLPFATVRYPGVGVVARHIQDPEPYRAYRFYAEMTAGAGQSYRRSVNGSGGLLHYYSCGAGVQTQAGRVMVSFGINLRADFLYNLVSREYIDYASNRKLETRYKQLYSVETPISLGLIQGRNTFGLQVIPGFQAGFSGREAETVNEQLVRSEQVTGKVDDSKTLTMETGVFFRRTLAPQWQFGCALNADILRPFGAPTFAGQQRILPLNGQISLRYTF